jgi:hypothetical protein
MKAPIPSGRADRGQVLVIVAMGLVAIVAMVGLVIDGGRAWTMQRDTQNGADAVAKAGTIVIQQLLVGAVSPPPDDDDVACATEAAAASNGVVIEEAEYVDAFGDPLATPVTVGACTGAPGAAIPLGAQGVRAVGSKTFDTLLMQVVGVGQLTSEANAIAVVGEQATLPGGALPVTFPQIGTTCANPAVDFTIQMSDGVSPWNAYEILLPTETPDSTNLAIVPLCDTAPGSVGWLDWGCGQNLSQAILNPCEIPGGIPIPAWVHTQTGNVNSLETELNSYAGPANEVGVATAEDQVLALPIHDNTCRGQPANNDPTCMPIDAEWSGNGNNLYYHIPFWVGFKLDQAYTQGSDLECRQAPGTPQLVNPQPPGKVGCLKGWFVAYHGAPGSINIGPIAPGADVPMTVTLIN